MDAASRGCYLNGFVLRCFFLLFLAFNSNSAETSLTWFTGVEEKVLKQFWQAWIFILNFNQKDVSDAVLINFVSNP